MHRCFTPCIYYHEIKNKNNNTNIKVICDFYGVEISRINKGIKNNCKRFKNYNKNLLTNYKNNNKIYIF